MLFVRVQTSQSAYSNASEQLTAMQLDRDSQILAVQETNRVKRIMLFSQVAGMFAY